MVYKPNGTSRVDRPYPGFTSPASITSRMTAWKAGAIQSARWVVKQVAVSVKQRLKRQCCLFPHCPLADQIILLRKERVAFFLTARGQPPVPINSGPRLKP